MKVYDYETKLLTIQQVKLYLCLIKHHGMETYEGVEIQPHTFLTSALERGEWSTSCPDCFVSRERAVPTE
jgi:hypothetical protein